MRPMRFVPALVLTALLSACGQSGDLYLPQKTPEPSQPGEDQKKKDSLPPAEVQPPEAK